MKIVLAGGTGQVGHVLRREFARDEVVVISRSEGVRWDGRTLGSWVSALEGADALINLAGSTIDTRYTPAKRRAIMRSRLESTWALVEAMKRCAVPPAAFLQSSTATIYADNYGPAWDETGRLGGDEDGVPDTWRFSIDVARRWEEAAAESPVRTVLMRTAMVMSPDRGGVFDVLYGLARRGLGGPAAGGRQYVSWMHDLDFGRAVRRLVEDPSFSGPVNLSSPNPVPYGEFMRVLRDGRVGLPATKWMLEIGAFFMRTETELVLKSRRVIPGRLLEAGFEFQFPEWEPAARDLVSRRA
ncbi:DUF1731 domain-containing protein [Solirubrobacter sp. CPCC 204708]|uniref:DUF1731 domain-containing protein n=1 Tax=Solirubrobacter deserti TaxID=2282478 RepID=A0ABT4RLJ8_9ACTN|nr:DUF1731 domain-containing protein [Solirubrobacter deserti]MBE2320454.1 DUF1731 domain-containing protein [Solirubrobacter deserti]MDA0139355.1 DUF1731 domain-containing protein [Solirubrobacter deserti]